jgi:thiol-disulfide isomerase/thioredoxin
MSRVWVAGFFCVLLLGTLAAYGATDGVVLTGLDGKSVRVDSLLAEGPVVLNFWATWCKPCRLEMPQLEKIHKDLGPRGVHFAAISLDSKSSEKRLVQYIQKYGVSLPVYRDGEGKLARLFNVAAIPTTVVLNQEGKIHHKTRGYRPGDEVLLKKKIEVLIKDRDKPAPETADEG